MAGWEVEAFFWGADNWAAMLGDKAPASMSDGGCLTVEAAGARHEVGSTEADGYMADGAACFARGAADEVGRVLMLPDSTDCTTKNDNLCAGAAAAADRMVASA